MGGCFGRRSSDYYSSEDSERRTLVTREWREQSGTHPTSADTWTSRTSNGRVHEAVGGAPCNHTDVITGEKKGGKNGFIASIKRGVSHSTGEDERGTSPFSRDDLDSGVHSRSEVDGFGEAKQSLSRSPSGKGLLHRPNPIATITSEKGMQLKEKLKEAYKWKGRYEQPTQEFLGLMDHIFMECQVYLTVLSTKDTPQTRREADALVEEMIAVRNHWGTKLLPVTICNAFVRERIPLTLGLQQYRIDCAQFFEPIPFYTSQDQSTGELMKLYRFSVYDLTKNEVVLRYYLERSNVVKLYHVLCYTVGKQRGQVHPYGSECPSYWEIRKHMLGDACTRLQSGLFRIPRAQMS